MLRWLVWKQKLSLLQNRPSFSGSCLAEDWLTDRTCVYVYNVLNQKLGQSFACIYTLIAFVQIVSQSFAEFDFTHGTDRCRGELESEPESVFFMHHSSVDIIDKCVFPIIFEPI